MRFAPALPVLCLLAACAQVRDPVGGDKDDTPPVLQRAEPANGSTSFRAERITLHFDERVKLDRERERLIISPPLDKMPDVEVESGTDVVIKLRAPLAENTTYTFNIGEAVVDLTENNPAVGLSYVMSTGAAIDSLELRGRVSDARTGEAAANMMVLLYSDTDSTGFFRGRPGHFTRTDKGGDFRLQHLRPGSYRVHALEDKNANYRHDLPNERVAFQDSLVHAGDLEPLDLRAFLADAPTQQVMSAVVEADRDWRLVLARPSPALTLFPLDRSGGTLSWRPEWNNNRDTVLFWPSDTTLLSGQHFELREGNVVVDTLVYRPIRSMPFNITAKAAGSREGEDICLRSSRPLERIRQDRVTLHIGTNVINNGSVEELLRIDTLDRRRFMLFTSLDTASAARLELLPGALRDIYGGENDTLRIALGRTAASAVGDLTLKIAPDSSATPEGPWIIRLLRSKGGVIWTGSISTLPATIVRTGLPADNYQVEAILDSDRNDRWTTGSLQQDRQPERVLRLNKEVQVRAGWELEVEWKLALP